jgi:hypothetical protein
MSKISLIILKLYCLVKHIRLGEKSGSFVQRQKRIAIYQNSSKNLSYENKHSLFFQILQRIGILFHILSGSQQKL